MSELTPNFNRYREFALAQGIPESCVDATVRWILTAVVAAIDIAWGDYPVQQCLLENQKNLLGTQREHDTVFLTSIRHDNDQLAPSCGGKE